MSLWKETAEEENKKPKQYDEFDAAFDYAYTLEKENKLKKVENFMVIEDDYQYGDEWDWDQNDKSQYCRHGKFIGSWWGPDILCGYCEAGDGPMNTDEDEDDEF